MTNVPSRGDAGEFVERMREEFEEFAGAVMGAVNAAADGAWIEGSEEQVRDLAAEFRRRIFEQAVQARVDAAEAAFPPSAAGGRRSGHRSAADETAGEQGPSEDRRVDGERPR